MNLIISLIYTSVSCISLSSGSQQNNYNIYSTLQGFTLAKGGYLPYRENPNIDRIRSTVHEFKMKPFKLVVPRVPVHLLSTLLSHEKESVGTVDLYQSRGPSSPYRLELRVKTLAPGRYSVHIHTFGDISDDCENAGPVYNPYKARHNGHLVDLIAHEDGNVDVVMEERKLAEHNNSPGSGLAGIYIKGRRLALSGVNSILGRSVVIHKNDINGPRIACGVLGKASIQSV